MTSQGAKFYKYAVEMINAREQAFDALDNSGDRIEGILEIQASSIPAVTFLPDLLAGFRAEHNAIQYYVSSSDTETVVENILERRGEIGFIGDYPQNNSFDVTKVYTDKSVMIAPESYDLPETISLADAVTYPFIWRETGSATRKSFEEAAAAHGYVKEIFEVAALFDDMDSVIRAVEAGLGVAIISEKVAGSIASRTKVIDIDGFDYERSFYMITLSSKSLSPAAEAFSEYVKEHI
jgi:DNA-binding transcriptional LysR family regulator